MTCAGCIEEPATKYPLGLPLEGAVTGCVEDALSLGTGDGFLNACWGYITREKYMHLK